MGNLIFRRSHNGKVAPFLKRQTWSQAQKDQHQRMGEASRYASVAVADPDLRPIYVQRAIENDMDPERPFDMAVKDYYHTGNDLLWKKHRADQEKPKNWDMDYYPRYVNKQKRSRRRKVW